MLKKFRKLISYLLFSYVKTQVMNKTYEVRRMIERSALRKFEDRNRMLGSLKLNVRNSLVK